MESITHFITHRLKLKVNQALNSSSVLPEAFPAPPWSAHRRDSGGEHAPAPAAPRRLHPTCRVSRPIARPSRKIRGATPRPSPTALALLCIDSSENRSLPGCATLRTSSDRTAPPASADRALPRTRQHLRTIVPAR